MAQSRVIFPIPVIPYDFSLVTAAYTLIPGSLPYPIGYLNISTSYDQAVMVSFDGVNDNFPIGVNGVPLFPASFLGDPQFPQYQKGQQFWVKYINAAPTQGTLWIGGLGLKQT
jgi:hypothetical protein